MIKDYDTWGLTATEERVLLAFCKGVDISTEDVAQQLRVTPLTIRTHLAAVMRKMDVHRRTAAVLLYDRERARRAAP